jgi:VWFA-related protein
MNPRRRPPRRARWIVVAAGLLAFSPQHRAVGAQDAPSGSRRLTFPVSTRLVQVSVIVHDKDGAAIGDLKLEDFQLFEDGKEQAIESFSVESDAGAAAAAATAAVAPNTFTNRESVRGGVTVILLDRLNTDWADQAQAKKQVVKFLEQIQPGDRVGLYVLESDVVRVLHDFSADTASLLKALARHRARTSGELAASEERVFDSGDVEMDVFLRESTRQVAAEFIRMRAQMSCRALEAIAQHLAGVRGRKNLIWVSSAFPLTFDDPIGRGGSADLSVRSFSDEVQRATRALGDANIAVYPVDARGVIGAFAINPAAIPSTPDSGRTMRGAFTTLSTSMPAIDTIQTIAENTGGRAFHGTNDIGGAIRRAVDDARVTYLLGYSPSHARWDGRFREIKVKVRRAGAEVRHRRGYWALPPQRDAGKSTRELAETLRSPLEATGIALSARVDADAITDAGELSLAIQIEARAVTLEKKGEVWEGSFALVIAQSNAAGRTWKAFDSSVDLRLPGEMRERLLAQGLVVNKKLSLREDAARVHVIVRDGASGATGSLIIPADRLRPAGR